jgi:hypothetical protein
LLQNEGILLKSIPCEIEELKLELEDGQITLFIDQNPNSCSNRGILPVVGMSAERRVVPNRAQYHYMVITAIE